MPVARHYLSGQDAVRTPAWWLLRSVVCPLQTRLSCRHNLCQLSWTTHFIIVMENILLIYTYTYLGWTNLCVRFSSSLHPLFSHYYYIFWIIRPVQQCVIKVNENPEELTLWSNELENSVSQLTNEYATRSWRYSSVHGRMTLKSSVDGLNGNWQCEENDNNEVCWSRKLIEIMLAG